MGKMIILNGQRFGHLLVIKYSYSNSEYLPYWECLCDCGKISFCSSSTLKNGNSKSCGCLSTEMKIKRVTTHGCTANGQTTLEYSSWKQMKNRCNNPNATCYDNYGGRGIRVCERWSGKDGFSNFFFDMGKRPTKNHTIDRFPNKDGDYEPGNCRWATRKEQSSNIRKNVWIEYKGERKIISEWSRVLGCAIESIKFHIKKGRSFDYIFKHFNNKKKQMDSC